MVNLSHRLSTSCPHASTPSQPSSLTTTGEPKKTRILEDYPRIRLLASLERLNCTGHHHPGYSQSH